MLLFDKKITGELYDITILGGGVVGLAAAITASQTGLRILVLEKAVFGGSVAVLESVSGYPGIEQIGGWELTQTMVERAASLGCRLLDSIEVSNVLKSAQNKFAIECTDGNRFKSRSVIITTGGRPRMLGLANEENFARRGIHTCAQCAGGRYRGTTVVIAGNGSWAVWAADHLLQLGCAVLCITKDNELRGETAIIKAILKHERFRFLGGCHVTGLYGREKLEEIMVTSLSGGSYQKFEVSAVFVYRGIKPNSGLVQASKDRKGFFEVDGSLMTSFPGVFAAGRVVSAHLTMAAMEEDGSRAALAAAAWLQAEV